MRAKRYTFEQMWPSCDRPSDCRVRGLTIPQTCKRLGIIDRPSTAGAPATAP
jgi:hypothetical protein